MNKEFSKEEMEEVRKEIPLGRIGKTDDVANIVYSLTQNTYITGEVIKIDGGWIG